jgi:hypothetical protein
VIDEAEGKIYWANSFVVAGPVSWAYLNGSGGGNLNTAGATASRAVGVTVDIAAGRIYWANREAKRRRSPGPPCGNLCGNAGASAEEAGYPVIGTGPPGAGSAYEGGGSGTSGGGSATGSSAGSGSGSGNGSGGGKGGGGGVERQGLGGAGGEGRPRGRKSVVWRRLRVIHQ